MSEVIDFDNPAPLPPILAGFRGGNFSLVPVQLVLYEQPEKPSQLPDVLVLDRDGNYIPAKHLTSYFVAAEDSAHGIAPQPPLSPGAALLLLIWRRQGRFLPAREVAVELWSNGADNFQIDYENARPLDALLDGVYGRFMLFALALAAMLGWGVKNITHQGGLALLAMLILFVAFIWLERRATIRQVQAIGAFVGGKKINW